MSRCLGNIVLGFADVTNVRRLKRLLNNYLLGLVRRPPGTYDLWIEGFGHCSHTEILSSDQPKLSLALNFEEKKQKNDEVKI